MKLIVRSFAAAVFFFFAFSSAWASRPLMMRLMAKTELCTPDTSSQSFPTDEQLEYLRRLFESDVSSASFFDLSATDRKVVSEALRIGHGSAGFSTRLLLDIAIIDALEEQALCENICEVAPILKYFSIESGIDATNGETWTSLIQSWQRFRDEDANAGRSCMGLVSTLPSRPTMNITQPKPLRNKRPQTNPYLSAALESKSKAVENLDQARDRTPEIARPNWMRPLDGQNICEPEIVTKKYPNDSQLRHYRTLFTGTQFSEVFLDLSLEARKTIAEALRIGQGAARFSTRLLLDMAVIDALDAQARCTEAACSVQDILEYFEIDRLIDPSKGRTWNQLVQRWRRFRDEDLQASRSCLPIVASLPDRYLETSESPELSEKEIVAAGENNIPPRKIADANPSAVPDVKSTDQKVCTEKLQPFRDMRILFLRSSVLIRQNDLANVGQIAKILKECPSSRVTVEGHTDNLGSADFNRRLSEYRAKSVASALVAAGADPSQLETRGFGSSRPTLRNDSSKSRQLSRRVEMNFGRSD